MFSFLKQMYVPGARRFIATYHNKNIAPYIHAMMNHVYEFMKRSVSKEDVLLFETNARNWGRRFIATCHNKNITPYIHAMTNHVSEFMEPCTKCKHTPYRSHLTTVNGKRVRLCELTLYKLGCSTNYNFYRTLLK